MTVSSRAQGCGKVVFEDLHFTTLSPEQGVAILSSVLNSDRATEVNMPIMRAFVKLRQLLLTHTDLACKLDALEKRYDAQFRGRLRRHPRAHETPRTEEPTHRRQSRLSQPVHRPARLGLATIPKSQGFIDVTGMNRDGWWTQDRRLGWTGRTRTSNLRINNPTLRH